MSTYYPPGLQGGQWLHRQASNIKTGLGSTSLPQDFWFFLWVQEKFSVSLFYKVLPDYKITTACKQRDPRSACLLGCFRKLTRCQVRELQEKEVNPDPEVVLLFALNVEETGWNFPNVQSDDLTARCQLSIAAYKYPLNSALFGWNSWGTSCSGNELKLVTLGLTLIFFFAAVLEELFSGIVFSCAAKRSLV